MKTIDFVAPIEFEDGSEIEVKFTAEFGKGGIGSYEFWGQKCYDAGRWELDNLYFNESNLTPEQATFLNKKVENRDYDDNAYDALDSENVKY